MLPNYLDSYNPLKERLTGKNEEADQGKVQLALRKILDGKAGNPEFGMVSGSAEEKALSMVGGNTGRFAGNYIIKNYDKLDPMVKDMVPLYGKDIIETEGALEKQKEMPVLPRVVESARRRQSERRARAKQPKASFLNPDMENVGLQEGGMVPVDGEGNVPPQAVAGDVVNGAPMGMVDVPNGGGPVDDGVPTELPEGTVVINAAAIRLHGTETIDKLISAAVDELLSEGVQISMEDPNPEDDVPVAISNGEYVIPPEVAEKIGYKKLEDMNERGRAYLQKQQAQEKKQAEAQQPSQPSQQPPESFMGPPMPQEQAGPPQAPVQSEQQAMAMMGMMGGGRVPYANGTAAVPAPKVGLIETLQNFMSQFGSNVSDMLGGKVEPTAEGFPEQLSGQAVLTDVPTTKPKSLIPKKPKKDFAAPFEPGNMNPAYSDETMPDPGNIFKARKTQARAQGGFIGEYNYAQPQQATMGTPFPNAVDSNPQQSQSFLQPNDAKKNFRVGLATGRTVLEQVKKGKDIKLAAPPPSMLDPTGGIPPKDSSFEKTEGPRTPRAKPKPVENVSYVTRMLMGEAGGQSLEEQKLVLDTLKNRIDNKQKHLRDTVSDRTAFEKAYQTFEKHYLDDEGNLRRRGTGRLQATAQQIKDKEDFVREYLSQPSQSNVTHMMKKGFKFSDLKNPQAMRPYVTNLDPSFAHDFYVEDPSIQTPQAKPTPPPRKSKVNGGFINLQEGGVAERASSKSKERFYENRQKGFGELDQQMSALGEELRKELQGGQLSQGFQEKNRNEYYNTKFSNIINNMVWEITSGTESVGGFAKKTSEEEKQQLTNDLNAFYGQQVYGVADEGISEREALHLDFLENFRNMPGSVRTSKADLNIDRTMLKNPDKNSSRQTRAIPNILEQKGSEAYTEFLTPEFNPLATQRNI